MNDGYISNLPRDCCVEVPIYGAKDFDRMVRETKPDTVIVTTKDATHSQYIIRAMEVGCDVMTEKPMTTDEKKCRAILDTQLARQDTELARAFEWLRQQDGSALPVDGELLEQIAVLDRLAAQTHVTGSPSVPDHSTRC